MSCVCSVIDCVALERGHYFVTLRREISCLCLTTLPLNLRTIISTFPLSSASLVAVAQLTLESTILSLGVYILPAASSALSL
jgi:hypothetical protein